MFVLGLMFGVFAISILPLLSSKTVNFTDLLQSDVLVTIHISISNYISVQSLEGLRTNLCDLLP